MTPEFPDSHGLLLGIVAVDIIDLVYSHCE
jgi:hypothetical protein